MKKREQQMKMGKVWYQWKKLKGPIRQSACNYNSVDSDNMVFDDGG